MTFFSGDRRRGEALSETATPLAMNEESAQRDEKPHITSQQHKRESVRAHEGARERENERESVSQESLKRFSGESLRRESLGRESRERVSREREYQQNERDYQKYHDSIMIVNSIDSIKRKQEDTAASKILTLNKSPNEATLRCCFWLLVLPWLPTLLTLLELSTLRCQLVLLTVNGG